MSDVKLQRGVRPQFRKSGLRARTASGSLAGSLQAAKAVSATGGSPTRAIRRLAAVHAAGSKKR